jgi:hypothetical protein
VVSLATNSPLKPSQQSVGGLSTYRPVVTTLKANRILQMNMPIALEKAVTKKFTKLDKFGNHFTVQSLMKDKSILSG